VNDGQKADLTKLLSRRWGSARVVDFTGRRGRFRLARVSLWFRFWEIKAKILHRFGIHTMTPLEHWDRDGTTVVPEGSICWLCPYRR
jgi:hypothetical protein